MFRLLGGVGGWIEGQPHSVPHSSEPPLTFRVSTYNGSLYKNSALGLRFQGNELSGLPHKCLGLVEAQAASWENPLPLFICGSPLFICLGGVLTPPPLPTGPWFCYLISSKSCLLVRNWPFQFSCDKRWYIYRAEECANTKSFLSRFFTEIVNGNNGTFAVYTLEVGEQNRNGIISWAQTLEGNDVIMC